MKIVIHISGGVLCAVYTDGGPAEVVLHDEDNLKADGVDELGREERLMIETKGLAQVF
jgi:hypothetical protein